MTQVGAVTFAAIALLHSWQVPPPQPRTAAPPGRGVISGFLVDAARGTVPRDSVATLSAQANSERQMQAQLASQARATGDSKAGAALRERAALVASAPPPPGVPSIGNRLLRE